MNFYNLLIEFGERFGCSFDVAYALSVYFFGGLAFCLGLLLGAIGFALISRINNPFYNKKNQVHRADRQYGEE